MIINTVTYILLSIIMYLFMDYVFGIIGFWRNGVSDIYYDKECFEVCDSYAVTLTSISLFLMIVLIPSNITIYNLTKPNNQQVRKIIKVPLYLVTVSLILLSICANIDIPEFRLDCYKREDGSIGIRDIFVDARDERFKTEVRIPEKIWFKPVGYVYDVCGKKVILSNKINYDAIASVENYRIRGSTDIEMDGLPITWYVEDNIIYKTDGTEMNITSRYYGKDKKTINISENIKKVNNANNLLPSNVEVIVDEKNPYFLSSDGMVFTKSNIGLDGYEMSIEEKNLMCNIVMHLITLKMRNKLF